MSISCSSACARGSPSDAAGDLEAVHVEESVVAEVGGDKLEAELKVLLVALQATHSTAH